MFMKCQDCEFQTLDLGTAATHVRDTGHVNIIASEQPPKGFVPWAKLRIEALMLQNSQQREKIAELELEIERYEGEIVED